MEVETRGFGVGGGIDGPLRQDGPCSGPTVPSSNDLQWFTFWR